MQKAHVSQRLLSKIVGTLCRAQRCLPMRSVVLSSDQQTVGVCSSDTLALKRYTFEIAQNTCCLLRCT